MDRIRQRDGKRPWKINGAGCREAEEEAGLAGLVLSFAMGKEGRKGRNHEILIIESS